MVLKRFCGALAALTLLAACASVLDVDQSVGPPAAGRIYHVLPFAQFAVTINRRVVQCTASEMKIKVTVAFERQIADDELHAYTIDPVSMRHLLNTAKLEVGFFESTTRLQTINASVQDSTAAVARHLIPAIGRLLTVTAGAGVAGAPPVRPCSNAVMTSLRSARAQKAQVERATDEVARLTAVVTQLRTRRATWPANADAPIGRLAEALAALEAASEHLAHHQRALLATLEPITTIDEVVWPEQSTTFENAAAFRMDVAKFRGWHNPQSPLARRLPGEADAGWDLRTRRDIEGGPATAGQPALPGDPVYRQLDVYLHLEPVGGHGLTTPVAREQEPTTGIRYRNPVTALLVACASRMPTDPPSPVPGVVVAPQREQRCGARVNGEYANEVGRYRGLVPQLGYVQTLQVRARPLESASFSATFTDLGGLAKAGYEHGGGGAAASEMLALAVTELADVREAGNTYERGEVARERDHQQALLQIAQAEAAMIALEDPTARATSAMTAETAMLRAQQALDEARRQAALAGQ